MEGVGSVVLALYSAVRQGSRKFRRVKVLSLRAPAQAAELTIGAFDRLLLEPKPQAPYPKRMRSHPPCGPCGPTKNWRLAHAIPLASGPHPQQVETTSKHLRRPSLRLDLQRPQGWPCARGYTGCPNRAASFIPDVTVVDREATLDGRSRSAIARVDRRNSSRHNLIIDPIGQFIGDRVVTLDGFAHPFYPLMHINRPAGLKSRNETTGTATASTQTAIPLSLHATRQATCGSIQTMAQAIGSRGSSSARAGTL